MKIRFSPRSRDDLADLLAHVDRHSPAGARTVRAAFVRSFQLIREVPTIGTEGEGQIRCVPVPRMPYLIYYLWNDRTVDVLHIRHSARKRPTFEQA